MLGDDGEATVDGIHFTDVGMMRYADLLHPGAPQSAEIIRMTSMRSLSHTPAPVRFRAVGHLLHLLLRGEASFASPL